MTLIILTDCINLQYHFAMDEMNPIEWIARCAGRLHERWRSVEPADLEEVAVGIWQNPELRAKAPEEAAAVWLRPITTNQSS